MVVNNRLSAAFAGLFLSAVLGLAPAAAQQLASLASDSLFLHKAGSAGLLQVKLGKLAEKKGTSPAVVAFGKRMVAHYSKANEELETAAKGAAFPVPVLVRQDQQTFDRFNRMGRGSFDRNYMAAMVEQHNEDLRLFQQQATNGGVQSLKQLASRMLPELEQRLSLARQTAGSVGAAAAASSSEPRETSVSY